MSINRRVVLTGGPGAGKTALLTALATRGYAYVPESARAIIQDRKQRGLTPRPTPEDFACAILRMDVDRYRSTPVQTDPVFFDRGIPDALYMLDQLGLLKPIDAGKYLSDFPYSSRVLVLPPWEEIYENDSEGDQTARSGHSIARPVREVLHEQRRDGPDDQKTPR